MAEETTLPLALEPAHVQARAIREGETSSRELLELFIQRIESLDSDINAVVTRDFDAARRAADQADAVLARGDPVGPLHGLPITIKDALETKGIRSTGGADALRDHIPTRDAPVVRKLKDAGAIVIGKTNLPEWSGDAQAYNELFGTTRNPWNLERVPGGSSGGAAAAVATGLTAFEIGTDIGGSIRFPAAFCGVFGHKPSFGIVPSTGYLDHAEGGTTEADVNVVGPIARSAEDLELLLPLLVKDTPPWEVHLSESTDVAAMRVAAWLDDPACAVDSDVLDVTTRAIEALEASGTRVDRDARPELDFASLRVTGGLLVMSANPSNTEIDVSHKRWFELHKQRVEAQARWAEFFERYDVLLMPVSFVPPFPHNHTKMSERTLACNGEERPYWDIAAWTMLVGMAYLPSTVPPIGLSSSGLPIGIQVVSRYGADFTTIRFAAHLARLCGGYPLAAITDPMIARRILTCLDLPPRAPPLTPPAFPEPTPGSWFRQPEAFDFDQTPPVR